MHSEKLRNCDFDCTIPHAEEAAERVLSAAAHEEGSESTIVAEAVNEQAVGTAAPESNLLNSLSATPAYLIHWTLLSLLLITVQLL